MKTYKAIAITAIVVLAAYCLMALLVSTYTNYAHYFIETKCELIIKRNGNGVPDNYYVCTDWHNL